MPLPPFFFLSLSLSVTNVTKKVCVLLATIYVFMNIWTDYEFDEYIDFLEKYLHNIMI